MNTAFVTGATGFLGVNIVRQLINAGVTVHALKRQTSDTSELDGLPIHWHVGDITNFSTVVEACPENVDAFFHAAADTSMWEKRNRQQNLINLTGTQNAIKAALAKHAKRFIHTSSIAAYGEHKQMITEASKQRGEDSFCNYYRTKHLSEQLVKTAVEEKGLDAVILNPCHLVGAPDNHNWSQMIALTKQDKLPGVPPGYGSFCDIKEVARAHIEAVKKGKTGENYILSGKDMSFVEFVEEIGKLFDKKTPARPIPAIALKLIGRVSAMWANTTGKEPNITPEKAMIVSDHLQVSSAKAQQELGYNADTDISAVLNECYQWMLSKKLV